MKGIGIKHCEDKSENIITIESIASAVMSQECIVDLSSDAKQLINVNSFQYHKPFITDTLKIQQNKIGARLLENTTLRPIPTWHLDTYSQIKITTQITYYVLFTFYFLLSHTAWTSLAACEHELDVFTAEQDQARYELLIILYNGQIHWTYLDKHHQNYKKCGTQELGFLDGQNYQLCLQHWIRKHRPEKKSRMQGYKTPVYYLELFGHMDFKWKN